MIAGDAQWVKTILEEDPAQIHLRDQAQWTLLDLAVKHQLVEVEEELRAAGATLSQNLDALFQEAGP